MSRPTKAPGRFPSQTGSEPPLGSRGSGRGSLDVELVDPELWDEIRLLGDLSDAACSTPGHLDQDRIDAILGVGE
jgi:hypothetical protein